eukprot:TRINITY_DN4949_c0_g1_i8.p1 TRINITY_DN4949_c0_g1~~TRINITY_DN4949_c0_g1_i8.p1  ORF type:complete len:138 (+),score=18.21 TRINITY_DN4949_c0_g1_i8:569-982(+)
MSVLNAFTNLVELNLHGCELTSFANLDFGNLQKLRVFDVSHAGYLPAIKWQMQLQRMTSLEILNLNHTSCIGDPVISSLSSLTNLRELDIGFTAVSNAGLEEIKKLTSLVKLNIKSVGYYSTVCGILEAFPDLKITT